MLRFLVALAAVAAVPAAVATTAPPMRRQYGGDITNAIDAKGAPECPCVATFPANVAVAAGLLAAKGFPVGYGLGECKAWDKDLTDPRAQALAKCDGTASQPSYCSSLGCYVDPTVCRKDPPACKAAGGVLGSMTSPACREKGMIRSFVLKEDDVKELYYSYHTCGSLDTYSENALQEEVAGGTMRTTFAVGTSPPWNFENGFTPPDAFDTSNPVYKGYSGVLVKTVDQIAKQHTPAITIKKLDGFASAQSREKWPASSYTACAMDVVVGKLDLCVGRFWVTAERLGIGVKFMIPLYNDNFYLIAPRVQENTTFWALLQKPWLPFSFDLWLAIVGFICFTSVVTLLTDSILDIGDELENRHPSADDFENKTLPGQFFKCVYMNSMAQVSGGVQNAPSSVPARLAALGFGWFILIVIASYTANLASIFTAQNTAEGITSIESAIQMRLTLCVYSTSKEALAGIYPTARIDGSYNDWAPMMAALHMGKCGAAILTAAASQQAFAGAYNTADCEKMDKGMTEAEAKAQNVFCVRDGSGPDLGRDCSKFAQVGESVLTVPVSMPISDSFVQTFSYSFRAFEATGEFQNLIAAEEVRVQSLTESSCGVENTSGADEYMLSLNGMLGAFFIAILIQVIALILCILEYSRNKTISQLLNLHTDTDEDSVADTGDSATKHDLRHEIHLLKQSHFAEIEEIKSMLGMPKGKLPDAPVKPVDPTTIAVGGARSVSGPGSASHNMVSPPPLPTMMMVGQPMIMTGQPMIQPAMPMMPMYTGYY